MYIRDDVNKKGCLRQVFLAFSQWALNVGLVRDSSGHNRLKWVCDVGKTWVVRGSERVIDMGTTMVSSGLDMGV